MKPEEMTVGTKVKSNREFAGVPKGTTGTIMGHYNIGSEKNDKLWKHDFGYDEAIALANSLGLKAEFGADVLWDLEPTLIDGFNLEHESQFLDKIE